MPFASFEAWTHVRVGDAWDESLGGLTETRAGADAEVADEAVAIAVRSAALETGAIEGLYATSRGITRTVALLGSDVGSGA